MIKGIGTDLVEKKRIKNAISKFGDKFIERVLTEKEKEEYQSKASLHKKISFISNNFACKEACSKVLGKGFSNGIQFKDIEVLRNSSGGPFIHLNGEASVIANDLKINNMHVSITD